MLATAAAVAFFARGLAQFPDIGRGFGGQELRFRTSGPKGVHPIVPFVFRGGRGAFGSRLTTGPRKTRSHGPVRGRRPFRSGLRFFLFDFQRVAGGARQTLPGRSLLLRRLLALGLCWLEHGLSTFLGHE
jgi:hypothetical protein